MTNPELVAFIEWIRTEFQLVDLTKDGWNFVSDRLSDEQIIEQFEASRKSSGCATSTRPKSDDR